MTNQQDYYRENEAYAEFLDGWDAGFYASTPTRSVRPNRTAR